MPSKKKIIVSGAAILTLASLNYLVYFTGGDEIISSRQDDMVERKAKSLGLLNDDFHTDLRTRHKYDFVSNLFVLGSKNKEVEARVPAPVRQVEQKVDLPAANDDAELNIRVLAITKHSTGVGALVEYGDQLIQVKQGDMLGSKYKVKLIDNGQVTLELQGVD